MSDDWPEWTDGTFAEWRWPDAPRRPLRSLSPGTLGGTVYSAVDARGETPLGDD